MLVIISVKSGYRQYIRKKKSATMSLKEFLYLYITDDPRRERDAAFYLGHLSRSTMSKNAATQARPNAGETIPNSAANRARRDNGLR